MISCSSDDEILQVNAPEIDPNKIEVTFDYEDYYFTAFMDTIILDLNLNYSAKIVSEEIIVIWSLNEEILKTESGLLKASYHLKLKHLDKEYHTVKATITNKTDDFKIEKSVLINNRTYVNLKYPFEEQKSQFKMVYNYNYLDNSTGEFPKNCEFTADDILGFESWEILKIFNDTIRLKIENPDGNFFHLGL